MAIPRSFIEQLLLHCDIEDIISSYAVLKREGRNRKCLCPFHSEKTPSMVVYQDTQSFYCFGCGAGGDVITFIMKIENLEYVEAVRFLARRVGMEVPDEVDHDRSAFLKSRILEINRETARFYHRVLKTSLGQKGLAYFKNRQLSDKTITRYGLGYAPEGWDYLKKHLREKGFTYEEMYAANVVARGKSGNYYDFFRNRVMFPVIDVRGNVIAFGGRVLDDSKPKYLNTSDTPVFKKSRNLFSLNFAKNTQKDYFILAEGYMDVIAVNAAGFENVVATLGTSLTSEQARLISKYAKEVVIAYDSDGAGQAATHRAINLFSEVGLATKILKMEGAKDPDEYIKKFGALRFERLLESAGNIVEFELNKVKAACNLEETDGKLEYIRRCVSILSSIKNRLEREVYAGIVAKETGVSQTSLISQVNAAIRKNQKKEEQREWNEIQANKKVASDRVNAEKIRFLRQALAEEGIIAFLFRNPDYLEYILSKIGTDDFVTTFNKRVFSQMVDKITENQEISLSMLTPSFSEEENGKISQILAKNSGERQTKKLVDDYIDVLLEHKHSLKAKDIESIDLDEIEKFRRLKRGHS
jgi:DNA primase